MFYSLILIRYVILDCYFGNKNLINKKRRFLCNLQSKRIRSRKPFAPALSPETNRPLPLSTKSACEILGIIKILFLEGNIPPYIRPATGTCCRVRDTDADSVKSGIVASIWCGQSLLSKTTATTAISTTTCSHGPIYTGLPASRLALLSSSRQSVYVGP